MLLWRPCERCAGPLSQLQQHTASQPRPLFSWGARSTDTDYTETQTHTVTIQRHAVWSHRGTPSGCLCQGCTTPVLKGLSPAVVLFGLGTISLMMSLISYDEDRKWHTSQASWIRVTYPNDTQTCTSLSTQVIHTVHMHAAILHRQTLTETLKDPPKIDIDPNVFPCIYSIKRILFNNWFIMVVHYVTEVEQ